MTKKSIIPIVFSIITALSSSIHCMTNEEYLYKVYYKHDSKIVAQRLAEGLTGNALDAPDQSEFDNQLPFTCQLIDHDQHELLATLLKNNVDPNRIMTGDLLISCPVVVAATRHKLRLCKLLIDYGGNVNIKDRGKTALHELCRCLDITKVEEKATVKSIRFLLVHHANPNILTDYNNGFTPLMYLIDDRAPFYSGKRLHEMIRLLIMSGADIEIKSPTCGNRSFHTKECENKNAHEKAVINKEPAVADNILQTAALRDHLFTTVAQGGSIFTIDTQGTSLVNIKNILGNSLLMHALQSDNEKVAQKLSYMWPKLLLQPNFAGMSILEDPQLRIKAIPILFRSFCSSS